MITRLGQNDLHAWKQIRLESLERHPEAFVETPEDFREKTDERHRTQLEKNTILGFYDTQDGLVGTVGFYISAARRMAHRGNLWAVYVKPSHRGKGIASMLMEGIIEHAKREVRQLHLAVERNNTDALMLYKKHGFEIYGTEPRAVYIEDRYYDDHLMVKILEAAS